LPARRSVLPVVVLSYDTHKSLASQCGGGGGGRARGQYVACATGQASAPRTCVRAPAAWRRSWRPAMRLGLQHAQQGRLERAPSRQFASARRWASSATWRWSWAPSCATSARRRARRAPSCASAPRAWPPRARSWPRVSREVRGAPRQSRWRCTLLLRAAAASDRSADVSHNLGCWAAATVIVSCCALRRRPVWGCRWGPCSPLHSTVYIYQYDVLSMGPGRQGA